MTSKTLTRDELIELAEKCEKASEPDRELDVLIFAGLEGVTGVRDAEGGRVEGKDKSGKFVLLGFIDPGKTSRNFSPYGNDWPRYTASLDAAMSLTIPGWRKRAVEMDNGDCWFGIEINDEADEIDARAKTWPLALCAAALRARGNQS